MIQCHNDRNNEQITTINTELDLFKSSSLQCLCNFSASVQLIRTDKINGLARGYPNVLVRIVRHTNTYPLQ